MCQKISTQFESLYFLVRDTDLVFRHLVCTVIDERVLKFALFRLGLRVAAVHPEQEEHHNGLVTSTSSLQIAHRVHTKCAELRTRRHDTRMCTKGFG